MTQDTDIPKDTVAQLLQAIDLLKRSSTPTPNGEKALAALESLLEDLTGKKPN
ncbi:hypothetical protein [Telmatospirillum sp.]|uniref:hypothetical protein n=1 Tax=Telmatospirillum sp. TaxID=2079197 RepID=UPI00284804C9|nr:hypothetical protein [Telmatospirillum sp.]MDR3436395.1 hypothetical protein [Telmatospirillum sp.]